MKQFIYLDDDESDIALTRELFEHSPLRIIATSDVNEVLKRLGEDPGGYVLVVSDIVMPAGQDGLYLAKEMAVNHFDVPLILVSGHPSLKDFEYYHGLKNYKGFMLKPLTPAKLEEYMERRAVA